MSETVNIEDKSFPFSVEFQHCLLSHMIRDDRFLSKCVLGVQEEYFADKTLSWVFRSTLRYWNEYQRSPTIQELENEVRKHDADKQSPYYEALRLVRDAKSVGDDVLRRELTAFVRRNKFISFYKRAATLYNAKRNEDAYRITKDAIDELIQIDFDDDKIVDFTKAYDVICEAKKGSATSVPTGIVPIDIAMGGGLFPGSFTTLLAGTNIGKSMTLVNIAYHAIMAGKKVVYLVHEDEQTPTILRFISRFTLIPYNKLMLSTEILSENEKRDIKSASEIIDKFLDLKFMYGAETTIEEVAIWLKNRMKESPFDLFIDDYGQILRTRSKNDGERFSQSIVHRGLMQICRTLNVAGLTVAQGNREAQKVNRSGTSYLRSTDLSECFEIARVSSNIITLNRSDDQMKQNELIFFLDKTRQGPVGIAVRCKTDYSRCITHDSSIGMAEANSLNPLLNDAKIVTELLNAELGPTVLEEVTYIDP